MSEPDSAKIQKVAHDTISRDIGKALNLDLEKHRPAWAVPIVGDAPKGLGLKGTQLRMAMTDVVRDLHADPDCGKRFAVVHVDDLLGNLGSTLNDVEADIVTAAVTGKKVGGPAMG
jgi:hypothetical protein